MVAGDLLQGAVLRLAPQPGLLPVQVELMLGDGGLPDALGQAGGCCIPNVHMDRTWVERSPRHTYLVGKKINLSCDNFFCPVYLGNVRIFGLFSETPVELQGK